MTKFLFTFGALSKLSNVGWIASSFDNMASYHLVVQTVSGSFYQNFWTAIHRSKNFDRISFLSPFWWSLFTFCSVSNNTVTVIRMFILPVLKYLHYSCISKIKMSGVGSFSCDCDCSKISQKWKTRPKMKMPFCPRAITQILDG